MLCYIKVSYRYVIEQNSQGMFDKNGGFFCKFN